MDYFSYEIRYMPLNIPRFCKEAGKFLAGHGLKLDPTLTQFFGVYRNDRLVGGGGYEGKIIKCVAVDTEFRREGVVNALISHIISEMRQKGICNVFIFTKPENEYLFLHLGFTAIERTKSVLLMEMASGAFSTYLDHLSQMKQDGVTGAIVMNCNPFTLGHQYLIETASTCCDHLVVFAVSEDVSAFPFETRIKLMREGTAHLQNVRVISGGDYIISGATFPSYFLKNPDNSVCAHAELDLRIFGAHIAPAMNITVRFAGEEPFSPVTALYNESMVKLLPGFGVAVHIIPRKETGGEAISASRVRALVAEGKIYQTKELLPYTTYRYLISPEAEKVCQKLQESTQ